ncbi:MAG TPA: hypothetical protein VES62_07280 [Thermoleophilaceae bacterium]|nr:hypothetical protein [Thermoleophilaceae bacterium]
MTLALVVVACSPGPPTCTCDLTVTGLEITQAIQTPTNTIQLVSQRSTAVRATIGVSGSAGPVAGVTGQLHVFVDGTEITPAAGVQPIGGAFTAPLGPQRANEADTLNFELPAPTGITASANVTFRVDLTPAVGETDTTNNSLTTPALSVVDRTTPSLFYTAIDYTPAGAGLPTAALIAPGAGDAFVRGILPVNDGDPNLYRQGLFPSLPYGGDADGDGRLNASGADGNDLLSLLASCRQLIVDDGLGATNNTFLYGWIAGNPIDGNGLAQVGGFNAFGNSEVTRGQRTYAHELTHNFGLIHINQNLDQVGWDVGGRLINNWSGNGVTDRVKPTTLFDIQDAGRLTNQAWIYTTNYNFLLASPVLASTDRRIASLSYGSPLFQLAEPVERVAVIQGVLAESGGELIRLEPVFRFPWASQPSLSQPEGAFVAEVVDEAGDVTRTPFIGLIADDPDRVEEREVPGFFEVMIAVDPDREIVLVRILDGATERELGRLEQSEPPTIRIEAPAAGAQLGERTEVIWEVTDPDTPISEILVQVAYSPDGGQSWVPIAVDVPASVNSIAFDSTMIQRSEGNGVLRVFASDGLTTIFDEVGGLTPTSASFAAP